MVGVNRSWSGAGVAFALVVAVMAPSGALAMKKKAKVYPTTTCASAKQKAAATYCGQVLKAWSKWEKNQDETKRQSAVTKAAGKLDEAWAKAEAKA